ncbi:MAG TPA: glycoside hydrolase domain-containing protein [Candidatus Angelobacter sp.]|nr:glycoside hydrolase domain-containing protein [Candidatus Angelobacter sp.]
MSFAGIDLSVPFPGDHAMRALKINTNLAWVGLYLAEKDHDKGITKNRESWVGQFMKMKAMGWGVAPIYVGKQVSSIGKLAHGPQMGGRGVTDFEGANDGDVAVGLAAAEKLPEQTIIYFDLEKGAGAGGTLAPEYVEYLTSWSRTVLSHGYLPGIYCSSGLGNFVATKVPAAVGNPAAMSNVWIFDTNKHQSASVGNPFPTDQAHDPKMSGFAKATAWQYAHKHFVRVPTTNQPLEVDLNTSIRKDPGRPGP